MKKDRILIGAQATECDPKMLTLTGDLATALAAVPAFIEKSNTEWDASPRNPKAPEPVAPPPPPRPAYTPSTKAKTATASKPAAPAAPPLQANFF
jgi:hypothetical protein